MLILVSKKGCIVISPTHGPSGGKKRVKSRQTVDDNESDDFW
jgi:hypothetical protein